MHEAAVEFLRIGIDQQLCRIEPEAVVGRIDAIGAEAVARAGGRALDEDAVEAGLVPPHGEAGEFLVARAVEQAELDAGGIARIDREFHPVPGERGARCEGGGGDGHVT